MTDITEPLTIIQDLNCEEHVALLERMGLRHRQPDRVRTHARALLTKHRCRVCGTVFTRKPSTPGQLYCSEWCRNWSERNWT